MRAAHPHTKKVGILPNFLKNKVISVAMRLKSEYSKGKHFSKNLMKNTKRIETTLRR